MPTHAQIMLKHCAVCGVCMEMGAHYEIMHEQQQQQQQQQQQGRVYPHLLQLIYWWAACSAVHQNKLK